MDDWEGLPCGINLCIVLVCCREGRGLIVAAKRVGPKGSDLIPRIPRFAPICPDLPSVVHVYSSIKVRL